MTFTALTAGTYIGRDGVLLLEAGREPKFVGAFASFPVPADVRDRAYRLMLNFGRDANEYMAAWCARKSEADYKAAA